MPQSSSSIASPSSPRVPISPFSRSSDRDGARTSSSQYTSDEQPDLGAFGTIFREWGYLQPPLRIPQHDETSGLHGINGSTTSMSVYGSGVGDLRTKTNTRAGWSSVDEFGSTVWNHLPAAQYIQSLDDTSMNGMNTSPPSFSSISIGSFRTSTRTHLPRRGASVTLTTNDSTDTDDTEGAHSVNFDAVNKIRKDSNTDVDDLNSSDPMKTAGNVVSRKSSEVFCRPQIRPSCEEFDLERTTKFRIQKGNNIEGPSLGFLGEALNFIATERARLLAQRFSGSKDISEPRKKNRRKRVKSFVTPVPAAPGLVPDQPAGDEEEINYEGEDENTSAILSKSNRKSRAKAIIKVRPKLAGPSKSVQPIRIAPSAGLSSHAESSVHFPTATTDSERKSMVYGRRWKKSTLSSSASLKQIRILTREKSSPSVPAQARSNDLDATIEIGVEGKGGLTPTQACMKKSSRQYLSEQSGHRRLLGLVKDLERIFPAEKDYLVDTLAKLRKDIRKSNEMGFAQIQREATLVHVFIDHSNILFGLLTYLKRHPLISSSSSQSLLLTGRRRARSVSTKSGKLKKKINVREAGNSGTAKALRVLKDPKPKSIKLLQQGETFQPPPSSTHKSDGNTSINSDLITATLDPIITEISPTHATVSTPMTATNLQMSCTFLRKQVEQATPPKLSIPLPSFATAARLLTNPWTDTEVRCQTLRKAARSNPAASIPGPMERSTSDDVLLFEGPSGKARGEEGVSVDLSAGESSTTEGKDEAGAWYEEPEGKDRVSDDVLRRRRREEGSKGSSKQRHYLWHTALTLILERGRPITRRVCVTSSPLYQPMHSMERLGYEVPIYIRVPDVVDNGMDKERQKRRRSDSVGHRRKLSKTADGATAGSSTATAWTYASNELDSSNSGLRTSAISESREPSHQLYSLCHQTGHGCQPRAQQRIRYKEQGVDELLQLKLHQAIAATDDVPEGATIVLATGDGNAGQFNEDGFLGPVRTALRRGWRVELYAWEQCLSRAWRKEFGPGSEWGQSGMFKIINLEQFAAYLVRGSTRSS